MHTLFWRTSAAFALAVATAFGTAGAGNAQGRLGGTTVVPAPAVGPNSGSGPATLSASDDCEDDPPATTTRTLARPIACTYTTPRGSFGSAPVAEPAKPPVVAVDDANKKPPGATDPQPVSNGGFAYFPPGNLVAQDKGRGRTGDRKIYLPGIIFPLKLESGTDRKPPGRHPYMNSQIWGYGGGGWNGRGAAGGSECDIRNYDPMLQRDTFCEVRSWDMPMCPGGIGHQGQDIRPPACDDNKWEAVAVVDGVITQVTSNTTVRLKGGDGTEYYYLHMHPDSITVEEGAVVKQGQVLGRVSNYMNGGRDTTHHLHFQVKQSIAIGASVQRVYVPVFASLIAAYRASKGLDRGVDDKGNLIPDVNYEIGAKPTDDPTKPPFTLWPVTNVTGDDGKPIEPIDLARAFRPTDEKSKLTFAVSGLPDGLSLDAATGLITGKLRSGAARGGAGGVYTVAATAADALGRTASQSFTITAKNKAPLLVAPTTAKTFREGDNVLIAAGSAFVDPNLDTLTFSAVGLPDYLEIDAVTGRISGVLALGAATAKPNGVSTVTVTANDGQGNTTSQTFALTALEPKKPEPPVIPPPLVVAPLPQITAVAGQELPVIETASAFQPAAGDLSPLRYSATGLPIGVTIDPATGQIKGWLAQSAAANGEVYPVVITAVSAAGGSVSQTLLLSVRNRPPTVTSQTVNKTYLEGDMVIISAGSAFSAAGDAVLVFTATGLPMGLSIDPKQGAIGGVLPAGTAAGGVTGTGNYTVSVTAQDQRGAKATETFTIAVAGLASPGLPPTASGVIAPLMARDGETITPLDVSRNFKPVSGGGPLVYSATGLPEGLTLDPVTGRVTGAMDAKASQAVAGGAYSVTVSAKDTASGLAARLGFVITALPQSVTPPVQPPSDPTVNPPVQPSQPQPQPPATDATTQGWWPWIKDKVSGAWGWWGKK